jgi:hypothetical protein
MSLTLLNQSGEASACLAAFDAFFGCKASLDFPRFGPAFFSIASSTACSTAFPGDALVDGITNGSPNLLDGFILSLLRRQRLFPRVFRPFRQQVRIVHAGYLLDVALVPTSASLALMRSTFRTGD